MLLLTESLRGGIGRGLCVMLGANGTFGLLILALAAGLSFHPPGGPARIELQTGAIGGAPPLSDAGIRTRQGVEAAWQLRAHRHQIVAGADWKSSSPPRIE